MNEENRITLAQIPPETTVTLRPLVDVAARSALMSYAQTTIDKQLSADILDLLHQLEITIGLIAWLTLPKNTPAGSEVADESVTHGKQRIFKVIEFVKPLAVGRSFFKCELVRLEDLKGDSPLE